MGAGAGRGRGRGGMVDGAEGAEGVGGRAFDSLPLVSLPKASASGTSVECETKSFSS